MWYILIFVAIIGLYDYVRQKRRINIIKRHGIRTTGVIVKNRDTIGSSKLDFYRLGGNINDPVIKFTTEEGQEIIGKPVVGFITQHEVHVPKEINVIYDPKNPKEFFIEM